jgi:hypothetical protein
MLAIYQFHTTRLLSGVIVVAREPQQSKQGVIRGRRVPRRRARDLDPRLDALEQLGERQDQCDGRIVRAAAFVASRAVLLDHSLDSWITTPCSMSTWRCHGFWERTCLAWA